jgi:initiation factor 1A
MGKNQKGGKGHKKGKNSINKTDKKLEFAGDLQKYAVITKILGNCRFRVSFVSENNVVDKLAILCGGMRKRQFIKQYDLVLISERDFEASKVDIIHKYQDQDVSVLKRYKELDGLEGILAGKPEDKEEGNVIDFDSDDDNEDDNANQDDNEDDNANQDDNDDGDFF